SVASLTILEDDKILTEQFHRLDRTVARQFVHQRGRLPVAAQQVARPGAASGACYEIVLFCAQHGELRSIHSWHPSKFIQLLENTNMREGNCPKAEWPGKDPAIL